MAAPTRKLSAVGSKIPYKGVYIWEAERTADYVDVIDKCHQNHITDIYITFSLAKAPNIQYEQFITEASNHSIRVIALFGDAMWALQTHTYRGVDAINSVAEYNDSVNYKAKFSGVQFDVEPHGLNGNNGYPNVWNTDRIGTIKSWLDNSVVWARLSRQHGLFMSYAILSFLDNTENYPVPTEYALHGANVNNIVTDMFDEIVLMAYRDTPEAIYNLAIEKTNYPNSRKVVVAFESTAQSPSYITFFEEGFLSMEAAMGDLHTMIKSSKGYKGVAVHAWRQWEPFLQPYMLKPPNRILPKE